MKNVLIIVLPYLMVPDETRIGYWSHKYERKNSPSTLIKSWPALPYGVLSLVTYNKDVANIKVIDCNVGENCNETIAQEMREFKPDIVGFAMTFDNAYIHLRGILEIVRGIDPNVITVIGGAPMVAAYQEILDEQEGIDAVCYGDGEIPFRLLLQSDKPIELLYSHPSWVTRLSLLCGTIPSKTIAENLDDILELDYSFIDIKNYLIRGEFSPLDETEIGKERFPIITSRGCPFRCLSGETIIHTIEGDIPIKLLVGKEDIKVLSRDPITQEPIYVKAINIQKTQELAEIVRVHFDDGSHIDCTPDHKFKVFKSKNQYTNGSEWDAEAKDLRPKQQVRAVRFEVQKTGRVVVSTRRDIVLYRAQIMMEAMLGRKLSPSERVHHKDRNPGNDTFDNFILTDTSKHTLLHPEISERMKVNNPAKQMTPEWRDNISLSVKGKTRSLEQRLRYRNSKLGDKNPMYNPNAYHQNAPSRIKELDVNHKVWMVEQLPYREDVYCMEVPNVHWFYANKVLVHNCSFCYRSRENDRKMHYASVDKVIAYVKYLVDTYGMNYLSFYDDQFLFNKKRAKEIFRLLEPFHLRVELQQGASVAFIDEEMAYLMSKAGVKRIVMSIESGSRYILDKMVDKPVNLDKVKDVVKHLRKYGIWATAAFVMGFPGELDEHREETLQWIKEAGLDWSSFSAAVPIRGTKLYDMCVEGGFIKPDIKLGELDVSNYFIHTPGHPPEYVTRQIYKMNLKCNFVENYAMQQGNYDTAAKSFLWVINHVSRDHAFAHYYLAECYEKMGYSELRNIAIKKFNEVVRDDPKWGEYARDFGIGGPYVTDKNPTQ